MKRQSSLSRRKLALANLLQFRKPTFLTFLLVSQKIGHSNVAGE